MGIRTILILTFLFLHFVAITKSRTQQDIFFDPAPFGTNVAEGEETILRCDVSNRKHITFYWTLNDRRVANTSRRYQVDSDLRILRVNKEEDSGSFRCIATNTTTGVSIRSIEARLNVFCEYDLYSYFCCCFPFVCWWSFSILLSFYFQGIVILYVYMYGVYLTI